MPKNDYGRTSVRVFAWLPKKLADGGWAWMRFVTRKQYIW